jgi:hypothetical protein
VARRDGGQRGGVWPRALQLGDRRRGADRVHGHGPGDRLCRDAPQSVVAHPGARLHGHLAARAVVQRHAAGGHEVA